MTPDALAQFVVLQFKSALAPFAARLAAVEARTEGDLRERVVTLETKSAAPVVDHAESVAQLRDRVVALETQLARPATSDETRQAVEALRKALDEAHVLIGTLRERVAVVETRAPVPGPAGTPGKDGRDGIDGTGWDDLQVEHDGERTFTFKSVRGERVKEHGRFVPPSLIYRGVYTEGKSYEPGDVTTWAGASWHCRKATTTKPDQGSGFWTLMVKQGRDGKDGKDAPAATPVVSLR